MSFQKKMVVAYTVFVFIVAVTIGFFYHKYNYNQYKDTEQKNLEISAEQLVTQMDDLIKPMELAIDYMLSDSSILSSIRMLATIGDNTDLHSWRYRSEAINSIQKGISTDYLTYTFYRTIFFNQNKIAISTYRSSEQKLNNTVKLDQMPWLEDMQNSKDNLRLVIPHLDSWRSSGAEKVFSLVKQIQGIDMGYIEIQRLMGDFSDNLQIAKEDVEYIIFINDEELLYTTKEFENAEEYQKFLKTQEDVVEIEGEEYFIAINKSEEYDVTVVALENSRVLDDNSRYIMAMTVLVAGVFFVISTVFVNILSGYLTKPIRQLREVMERTDLENIGEDVQVKTPNDEIEALNISYQNLLERLQESLVKEKRLSLLHIQAQFDTLQSQVNPHFLYNVLNVISARGIADDDEKICEMCGSLAMMLRYSTNTKTRYASIAEELEYLKQYFYLLKARYEYKLDYEICVDSKIEDQIVPKMVLQQIVENCINHGFENSTGQMYVRIEGKIQGEYWKLKIHDNGEGFGEETMKELQGKFSMTRKRLLKERSNMELEIGGMGLNNSYARMLLLYNDDLIFELKNSEDGADVIIGGNYQKRESQEEIHV